MPDPARSIDPPSSPRLLDQVQGAIRRKHYSLRTEDSYVRWIKRFIYFHGKRHPKDLGAPEVTTFVNHLAGAGRSGRDAEPGAFGGPVSLQEVLETPFP